MGLFVSSEAPGLVFSATYQRGSLAPSALSRKRDLRFPPLISREKTAPSHQSLPKSPTLGAGIYFRLILHPIPFRLGVPNSFPSFSVAVRILKFDFSHS